MDFQVSASLFQDEQVTKIQITQSLHFVKMFFISSQADNESLFIRNLAVEKRLSNRCS